MREDAELLRRYVEQHSEEDFAELVGRYSGLVYHAALRRVQGRADLAKDIAQDVFANLARQATSLLSHPVLSGWLYTTTRFVANRHLRDEHRRADCEREAQMRNEFPDEKSPADSEQIYCELDGAMNRLDGRDREAICCAIFTMDRAEKLVEILADANKSYKRGEKADTDSIKWEQALPKAEKVLNPAQFAALKVYSNTVQLGRLLKEFHQQQNPK